MQVTRLANGVRVLSERLPDLVSVTVGIWVENGSRYEREDQAGISDFLRFLEARYRPDRILIAAAGDVVHDDLLGVVTRNLGALVGTVPPSDGAPPAPRAGVWTHEKSLEQVHLCLGTPGIAQTDADR